MAMTTPASVTTAARLGTSRVTVRRRAAAARISPPRPVIGTCETVWRIWQQTRVVVVEHDYLCYVQNLNHIISICQCTILYDYLQFSLDLTVAVTSLDTSLRTWYRT